MNISYIYCLEFFPHFYFYFFIPTNLTFILKSITKKHIWFLSIIYFHSKTTSRHEKQEDQNKNEASVLS